MRILLSLAVAASLSACAVTIPRPAGPADHAHRVAPGGERAFAAAKLAYITAASGVGKLVDAGLIRGAAATRVRAWNREARALLVSGKAAADKAGTAERLFELAGLLDAAAGEK